MKRLMQILLVLLVLSFSIISCTDEVKVKVMKVERNSYYPYDYEVFDSTIYVRWVDTITNVRDIVKIDDFYYRVIEK